MKKIYGLFGVAALFALASCSNETMDGPEAPEGAKGDLYLSMQINPTTRTATPEQGQEVGKDYENKLSSALIIFAKNDKVFYAIEAGGAGTSITGTTSPYSATFPVDRNTILNDIANNGVDSDGDSEKDQITYDMYVIANPTDEIKTYYKTAGNNMQKTFSLNAADDTYWKNDKFLMSNASKTSKTIKAEDIPAGTHDTEASAYPLGTVEIQRTMSRFDINKSEEYTVFTIVNGEEDEEGNPVDAVGGNDITVTFDAVALINEAKDFYMFKVVSTYAEVEGVTGDNLNNEFTAFNANPTLQFGTEAKTNYVFSPNQTSLLLPLFANPTNGAPKRFDDSSFEYTSLSTLNIEDNAEYTYSQNDTPRDDYYFWTYCTENTIFDKSAQLHGVSTGVIFRAFLTGDMITKAAGEPVYAYSTVILGKYSDLEAYVNPEEGADDPDDDVFEMVQIAYKEAIKNAGESASQEAIDAALVNQGFAIYRPTTDGKYYCYYTYWNRHNDNGQDTVMGPMEFATVRNNVYKLNVEEVFRLGHPTDPKDDPDPEDPGTPDEQDKFYCSIICKVLPWEVRINKVKF